METISLIITALILCFSYLIVDIFYFLSPKTEQGGREMKKISDFH